MSESNVVPIPDDLNLAARHLLRAAMTICNQSGSDLNEFAKWLDVDSGMSEGILATIAKAGLTAEANKERAARIKAQQELEQLREDLTKRAQQAQKDAYQRGLADGGMSLKLVADIRFALGDDGKRMQGELVEYCKELCRDAERWRLCLRDPEKGDFAVCKWDWDELSWMPTNTDAIDAAMQTQAPDGDKHGR